jgi:hypothetical protein
MRGGQFELSIKGLDELIIDHDSVMLEACNSSFQVHLQVDPSDFARRYNFAQVLLAPLMAIAVNSPLFLGKRLWSETRVALFRQAVDTRSHVNHMRETEARVNFGTRWVKQSVTEIFQEDIARYRALVGTDLDEDPIEVLNRGGHPADEGPAAAQRHHLPLEPRVLRRAPRAARTCASRTASCPRGRAWSTRSPTPRSGSG